MPVIVVGNLVVGGAGKTPIVIELVQYFQKLGIKVGVISRGYGRKLASTQLVTGSSQVSEVGDEPLLIHSSCQVPVSVAHTRYQAGMLLLDRHPELDLIISDDGLQHFSLQYDRAICVFNEYAWSNGLMLPAGPLRQPLNALNQLSVPYWVLAPHEIDLPHAYVVRKSIDPNTTNLAQETRHLAFWTGKKVAAFAGIAHPELFFDALKQQGFNVVQTQSLPDHSMDPNLLLTIQSSKLDWFCTEKDAIKLRTLSAKNIWIIKLRVQLPETFINELSRSLSTLKTVAPNYHDPC